MSDKVRWDCNSVGSDESGTGGLFGGCAFAAFRLTTVTHKKLKTYPWYGEVCRKRDSNKLSDEMNLRIYEDIIRDFKKNKNYSLFCLEPKKYNDSFKKNLSEIKCLKIIHHNKVHAPLNNEFTFHAVDNFLESNIGLYKNHLERNGEEKIIPIDKFSRFGEMRFLSISIASIIARGAYLTIFNSFKKEFNIELSDKDNHNKPQKKLEHIFKILQERGYSRDEASKIFCKIDQYQNYLKSFPTLKKPS